MFSLFIYVDAIELLTVNSHCDLIASTVSHFASIASLSIVIANTVTRSLTGSSRISWFRFITVSLRVQFNG